MAPPQVKPAPAATIATTAAIKILVDRPLLTRKGIPRTSYAFDFLASFYPARPDSATKKPREARREGILRNGS